MGHPAPHVQKAVSQQFRAEQAILGDKVAAAMRRIWNAGFEIRHARKSWETVRPIVVKSVKRYYKASQVSGRYYYNTCRVTAGLGVLPDKISVSAPLTPDRMDAIINSCGLGWFLHMVKNGAMMMDAYESAREKLATAVDTLVLAGARDWIQAASDADPESQGVRRVTSGTCDYCDALAAMGANVPPGGWHNDCKCTSEPTFGSDIGPSPSLPTPSDGDWVDQLDNGGDFAWGTEEDASVEGQLGIDDASWNNTIDFIGNSLKSGNLKDAQAFLNPDGTLNEGKAIVKLIEQHKAGEPYSLSASGKLLNKTQTKLLDKFFKKIAGHGNAATKSFEKAAEKAAGENSSRGNLKELNDAVDKALSKLVNSKSMLEHMQESGASKFDQGIIKQDIADAKKAYDEANKAYEDAKAGKSTVKAADEIKHPESTGKPLTAAEQKQLDSAINGWKTGNQVFRKDMQDKILQFLSGKSDGVSPDARAVARAFQEQTTEAPQLYRGLSWNLNDPVDQAAWNQMKTILDNGIGSHFDLPPSSFSEAEEWPGKFMEMKTGDNTRKMKIILQSGSRGLNIEELGVKQGELEWLNGGRFEVVAMGKHGNSFNLVIKQVSGLDKPLALKKAESVAFVEAIGSWKGSSSYLSKQITSILQGNISKDPTANVIVDYLRTNTEPAPTLYRGLHFWSPEQAQMFSNANEVGKTVDIPASSFSVAKSVAQGFASGPRSYIYQVVNGKGMNITDTGGIMQHEKEWISGGRFEVIGRENMGNDTVLIKIKQLQVLVQ
jgi:hypothetical protein